jgi:site-specific recombinase XerD
MAGCRPLSEEEVQAVLQAIRGDHALRNRALFVLGCNTGFRVSELLSLNVGDLLKHGRLVDKITVQKRFTKGKTASRSIALNRIAKAALDPYLRSLDSQGQENQSQPQEPVPYTPSKRDNPLPSLPGDLPLFHVKYRGLRRMTRHQAWRVLHGVFEALQLQGQTGTHTMRKTFSSRIYPALDYRVEKLQQLLGHKWVTSTISYISDISDGLDEVVLDNPVGG